MGSSAPSHTPPNERINLALGGGGAKGIVHVGALEGLHEMGFEISTITGTSVGAIVAGLFAYYRTVYGETFPDPMEAQGRAVKAVRHLIEQTRLVSFKDLTLSALSRGRLLEGAKLFGWLDTALLNRTTGKASLLGEMKIPLLITAANAENGATVTFTNNGPEEEKVPISQLIRASTAIPGVFPEVDVPLLSKTVTCWDGGVCGNCRFDLASTLMPELRTVAVSVTYSGKIVNPRTGWVTRAKAFPIRLLYGMSPEIDHSMSILMKACEDNAFNILPVPTQRRIIRIFPEFDDVSTLDFDLNKPRKRALFDFGNAAVKKALGGVH